MNLIPGARHDPAHLFFQGGDPARFERRRRDQDRPVDGAQQTRRAHPDFVKFHPAQLTCDLHRPAETPTSNEKRTR